MSHLSRGNTCRRDYIFLYISVCVSISYASPPSTLHYYSLSDSLRSSRTSLWEIKIQASDSETLYLDPSSREFFPREPAFLRLLNPLPPYLHPPFFFPHRAATCALDKVGVSLQLARLSVHTTRKRSLSLSLAERKTNKLGPYAFIEMQQCNYFFFFHLDADCLGKY